MAPTNDSTRRRGGGGGTGRPHRYANTHAGVNRSQFRAAPQADETYLRRNREHRGRSRATVPVHASLASRMTYGLARGHGHGHASRAHGGAPRAHHQQARPLQDRITHAYDGRTGVLGTGFNTAPRAQTGHSAQQAVHTTATNDTSNASPNDDIDIDINIDSDIELDDLNLSIPRPPIANATPADNNTSSNLFHSSQPTQLAPRPIRMFNSLPLPRNSPHRPVNTYRGNDPIKRRVQNPKLRAIFADKPVPKERKKSKEDRMDLRQGMGKVTK